MTNRPLALAVSLAALGPAGGCDLFESRFVATCEAAIGETLSSPSSYRRVDLVERAEPLSLADYLRGESPSVAALVRRTNDHAVRSVALFAFDADNAFGTPVRASAECTYDSLDGDASRANEFTVLVDGKTRTERLAEVLRQAQ